MRHSVKSLLIKINRYAESTKTTVVIVNDELENGLRDSVTLSNEAEMLAFN